MADAPADVAASYFDAWKRGDFARLRTILADDVTFDGPLGHAANAEECIAGLRRAKRCENSATKALVNGRVDCAISATTTTR